MVRRYDEQVQVQVQEPGEPVAFVWRGRLYVVRAVLSRWHERRVWWREAAASALLGLRADDPPGAVATVSPATAGEREVWRVEAMAGRSSPVGVYELVRDPSQSGDAGTWLLTRIDD